jgi:SAM-dependent methyltransferase
MDQTGYIRDWSPIPASRYEEAQQSERGFWSRKDRRILNLEARYYFYAGYYQWSKHRALCNPFCVRESMPGNFQIPAAEMQGSRVLDVGCGPASQALSLVHCASVCAVDPLLDTYREMQPFGWEFFETVHSVGAEELPFDDGGFDFAYCRNVLDHTRNADEVLSEITRVLHPHGQLLLDCDTRHGRGGGPSHPYAWTIETLEARIFDQFEPVIPVSLRDYAETAVGRELSRGQVVRWICRLRRKTTLSSGRLPRAGRSGAARGLPPRA